VHLNKTFHSRVAEEQKHPPKVLQMKHFSGQLIIKVDIFIVAGTMMCL